MDRRIFVVSDTHFGHENIIGYQDRPFHDIYEMNETMIKNWNSLVSNEDIIYHLGDVYTGDPSVLKRLNGRKRLILGNHDNPKDQNLQKAFEKIMLWRPFPELGIILSHIPLMRESFPGKCIMNYHGHIHSNESPTKDHRNVSVEKTGYAPVRIR